MHVYVLYNRNNNNMEIIYMYNGNANLIYMICNNKIIHTLSTKQKEFNERSMWLNFKITNGNFFFSFFVQDFFPKVSHCIVYFTKKG